MLKLLVLAAAFGLATAMVAEEALVPPAPTRPVAPDTSTMSDVQRREATKSFQTEIAKWRKDTAEWEARLTPEQKAVLRRQREEEHRRMQEEFERQKRLPLPTDGYTWREAAKKWKIDAAAIERLEHDHLAYGPTLKQSFSAYLGGPVFITTDSVLNAYHVLFEDSFREYELRQYGQLREKLGIVLGQARENLAKAGLPPSDTAPAWRHAQYVIGPALVLLGLPLETFDPEVRPEIEAQVGKIRAAEANELPTWLAPATRTCPSVDYRACKPVGFYVSDPKLADYFRAVRWLQSVPFRADRDIEFGAMGMLGYGLGMARGSNVDEYVSLREYFRNYGALLGRPDARDLLDAADTFQNLFTARGGTDWAGTLLEKRRWVLRETLPPETWRQWPADTLPPAAVQALASIEFRVLPAWRVPDSALFQALANQNLEPEGLAVAVALGSDFARTRLSQLTPQQIETALPHDTTDQAKRQPSLYEDYLDALRGLFLPPPSDAPPFLRNEAWQAKSTQTALAGWAQLRHTFSLQAKVSQHYLGMTITPPGFIEPNPTFFARMADVIERGRAILNANRDRWDELASACRRLEALTYKQLHRDPWSDSDERFIKGYGEQMAHVMGYGGNAYLNPEDDAPRWAEVHRNQRTDASLAVAVGRPRTLWVLYPWNGMEVLCRGAVMPYYEYHSKERLTDAGWKQLLDSPDAPAQPAWAK